MEYILLNVSSFSVAKVCILSVSMYILKCQDFHVADLLFVNFYHSPSLSSFLLINNKDCL